MILSAPRLRALIYVRFSPRPILRDDLGREIPCASADNQEEDCRALCVRKGYEIAGVFRDEYISGGTFGEVDRPGLAKALEALRRGWILICFDPDRLAKGVLASELIYEAVHEAGARVEFAQGGIVADDLEGEMIRRIQAVTAEYNRKKGNQRTSWAVKKHLAAGRRICNPQHLPYGMRLDVDGPKVKESGLPARMLPDPEEQAIVARILAWAADGKRPPTIKRLLEGEGVLCRGKKTWNRPMIARIISRGGME